MKLLKISACALGLFACSFVSGNNSLQTVLRDYIKYESSVCGAAEYSVYFVDVSLDKDLHPELFITQIHSEYELDSLFQFQCFYELDGKYFLFYDETSKIELSTLGIECKPDSDVLRKKILKTLASKMDFTGRFPGAIIKQNGEYFESQFFKDSDVLPINRTIHKFYDINFESIQIR